MRKLGALLVAMGAGSFALPYVGMQLRLLNFIDEKARPYVGGALTICGLLLIGADALRQRSRAKAAGRPPPVPPDAPPPSAAAPAAARVAPRSTPAAESRSTAPRGAARATGKPLCSSCFAPVDAGAEFCGECGNPLGHMTQKQALANGGAADRARCPQCGAVPEPAAAFCGECGARLGAAPRAEPPARPAAPAPAAPPRASAGAAAGRPRRGLPAGCLIALLLLLAAAGGALWLFFGPAGRYQATARTAPAMPARMAGVLREFPVDVVANRPLVPASLVTRGPGGQGAGLPPLSEKTLPRGVSPDDLARCAATLSTATYRSAPQDVPITVHSADVGGNFQAVATLAQQAWQTMGGNMTQVTVQSANGTPYAGFLVRTLAELAYFLMDQRTGIMVLIYAPDASAQEGAARLASAVGNGNGVADYPAVGGTLGALPAAVPAGLELRATDTRAGDELAGALNSAEAQAGGPGGPEVRQLLQRVRLFIPTVWTRATYGGGQGRDWTVTVADYGSARRAANLFRLLRWTLGLRMTSVDVRGCRGLSVTLGGAPLLVFQRGPYFGVVSGPPSAALPDAVALGSACQF